MVTDRSSRAILDPRQPRQATYVELFFDLVFIFIFFRLAQTLFDRLTWVGAYETLITLLAVWLVWSFTNLLTDTLDSRRMPLQLVVIGSTLGGLVISTAIPEAFETRGLRFATAYVAINVIRGGALAIALRHHPLGRRPLRAAIWFAATAVLWFLGALLDEWRMYLWTVAVVIDYLAAVAGWPVPRLGRTRPWELNLAGEHIAERYRQLIIIALGETVAVSGRTAHDQVVNAYGALAVLSAFGTTTALYYIYFHRTRERLGPAFAAVREPGSRSGEAALAHLVMAASVIAVSVTNALVIRHPLSAAPTSWVAVALGGPALFLAGHTLLGRHVFSRASEPRLIGLAALLVAAPLVVGLPMLAVCGLGTAVLVAVAGFDVYRTGRDLGEQAQPLRQ